MVLMKLVGPKKILATPLTNRALRPFPKTASKANDTS